MRWQPPKSLGAPAHPRHIRSKSVLGYGTSVAKVVSAQVSAGYVSARDRVSPSTRHIGASTLFMTPQPPPSAPPEAPRPNSPTSFFTSGSGESITERTSAAGRASSAASAVRSMLTPRRRIGSDINQVLTKSSPKTCICLSAWLLTAVAVTGGLLAASQVSQGSSCLHSSSLEASQPL